MPSASPDTWKPKTLSELCEPFFLKVCEVLRCPEYGGPGDACKAREALSQTLDKCYEASLTTPFRQDYARIEPDLAFFADDVISRSRLPWADQWKNELLLAAKDRINVRNGRQLFFNHLDAVLGEPPATSAERRLMLFQCLALGFCGIHQDDPDLLKQKAAELLAGLPPALVSRAKGDPICPKAYDVPADSPQREFPKKPWADTSVLYVPVGEPVWKMIVALAALLLVSVVVYLSLLVNGLKQIQNTVGEILNL